MLDCVYWCEQVMNPSHQGKSLILSHDSGMCTVNLIVDPIHRMNYPDLSPFSSRVEARARREAVL